MLHTIYPTELFSRNQIAQITGLDDSTLNYWMRENVLRAAQGGTGRGSHRKFAYYEATLAGILNEFRNLGLSMPALAGIAGRFHNAIDWMAARSISLDNLESIELACEVRRDILQKGYSLGRHPNPPKESKASAKKRLSFLSSDKLGWDDAIEAMFKSHRAKNMRLKNLSLSPIDKDMVHSWESLEMLEAFDCQRTYFHAVASIADFHPDGDITMPPLLFFKNAGGEWELGRGDPKQSWGLSHIAINVELLTHGMWSAYLREKAS